MMRFLLKIIAPIAALVAVYAWWIEPARLSLTEQVVADPERRLKKPIRLLLLTDWHLGRWSRPRSLRAKMARLARRHARAPFDAVLLGGDFLDADARWLPRLAPALDELARWGVPVIGVLGNHDYTSCGGGIGPLTEFLAARGVLVLCNGAVAVTAHGQKLWVIGLDDLQESDTYYHPDVYRSPTQYKRAAQALDWYARFDDLEPDLPRVVLAHNPDAVHLPGRDPLAVLAGHTHGGQVMLVDWLGRALHQWLHVHLPPGSAVTWAGRQVVGGRTLIVSRGVEGLPLRLGRPPEAVIVVLQ